MDKLKVVGVVVLGLALSGCEPQKMSEAQIVRLIDSCKANGGLEWFKGETDTRYAKVRCNNGALFSSYDGSSENE